MDLNEVKMLDEQDVLKDYRNFFQISDNLIYLDGNSLGVMPVDMPQNIDHIVRHEWGNRLIRSWNEGWYERPKIVAQKIAHLIGAHADEVIVADSTSINLFKLAFGALKYQQNRHKIVSDDMNFPSDLYIFQGLIDVFNQQHQLEIVKSPDAIAIPLEKIAAAINEQTALLSLSHVVFKSSFMYNMKAVTKLAHKNGALVLWDLSHAVGAVPIDLSACNADLAVGCTYKYLNGGPGSPAFLYVRKDLQEKITSPIWGWFGEKNPFDFRLHYEPAQGIEKFMAGTPPVLSLSAVQQSVDILLKAGIDAIRNKSVAQSEFLIAMIKEELMPHGFSIGSPLNASERGSHISIKHKEAYRICKALIDPDIGGKAIIPDFREPDNIRIGITPLYTRYEELYTLVKQLKEIVKNNKYSLFSLAKDNVT